MAYDKSNERLIEKRDLIHIAILAAIALVIGVYLIATTVLISKDGVFYIERAQQFSSDPVSIFKPHPPGYPFLILTAHRFVGLFSSNSSVQSWIYSAQGMTLLCRLLALIPLYFMGKLLVGGKNSFLGLLILIFLPYPTRIVCDVVREWPHLLFLATGFFFLLWSAKSGKWWLFGFVGLSSGLGYLIRPESAQLVVYGFLWVAMAMFRPKLVGTSRWKSLITLALLIIGFAVPVVPYMKCTGRIVPPKVNRIMKSFSFDALPDKTDVPKVNTGSSDYNTAEIVPGNVLKALGEIFKTIGENLMWFFMPGLVIGLYYRFRGNAKFEELFLVSTFIFVNVVFMVLRYCYIEPHISQRWSMPLVAFTIFYIPVGLQVVGNWLNNKRPHSKQKTDIPNEKRLSWFVILLLIGIGICTPKLLRPVRIEKQGYRKAANWLRKNTAPMNVIAVSDKRIAFYAERKGFKYDNGNTPVIPVSATYIVKTTEGRYHEESKSDKTSRYNTDEIGDDNESDIFLSEIKRYSSLKGLVGYWAANNDTLDYSIYRNHATAHGGVSYTTGKYGQAFNLIPGMNSYIDCGKDSSLNPTDSVTVSAWIYPVTNSRGSVITRNSPYYIEFRANRRIRAGVHAGSSPSWTYAISASALSLHTWHHVVMTYDGSYIKIYVDGEIDGIPAVKSGDMAIGRTSVYVGYGLPGLNHYFNGLIDEIMLFNTALQLDKIKALNKMVKSKTVPTFGINVNAYPIFDRWKIKREYSLWVDELKKKKKLCIYKIE